MKHIQELAADRDQKAQQLADLEAAAQVVVGMVEDEEAGERSLLERLRETSSDSAASSPILLGITWLMP